MLDEQGQGHSVDVDMTEGSRPVPNMQSEKIIFCIDLDLSMDEQFMNGEKMNDTRINRTKQVLKWFIDQKSKWNPQHEFALIILGDRAVWHMDFTSDTGLLEHALDELYTMGKFPGFESTSLFQLILQHVDMSTETGPTVRAIMIYTRSDILPTLPESEVMEALHASRRFYFDCVYIHNKATEVAGDIRPQEVYDRLTEIEDARSPGYFYEMTRVLRKFSGAMGELLANPAIRPIQEEGYPKMPLPPSIRAKQETMEQQRNSSSSPSATKRTEIPIKYKTPEMIGVSPLPTFIGGNASPSQGASNNTSRTPPPPPPIHALGPSSSPFLSSSSPMREAAASPSRGGGGKSELSQVSSSSRSGSMNGLRASSAGPGGAGGGSGSGSGSGANTGNGTGMDDAILI